jgi:hypothetical protein
MSHASQIDETIQKDKQRFKIIAYSESGVWMKTLLICLSHLLIWTCEFFSGFGTLLAKET